MAVLVLGGAGYIGSHTVYALCEAGREVVVVDNLETGHQEAVHEKAAFYQGDISDTAFLHHVLRRESIDGVIHFAAYSIVAESMRNPLKYYENNVCKTKKMLEVLLESGVQDVVFSSTAAVYGEPNRVPISEQDPTEPTNPYGATKLAMEQMFRWVANTGNLRFVSLRYFNACGAHQDGKIGEAHPTETHLIPLLLQVANGKRDAVAVFGCDYPTQDGTCVRDYIHVADLADAHILALDYLKDGGKSDIFNLGNGVGFSVKEVIEAARRVTGHAIPVQISERREGDPARLVASSQKAKNVLGWKPRYHQLEEMVETAWRWHRRHPEGY
ncbi:MAG TPA: UDP-glucose 4-epimerase GalE [Candidatus Anaerotignum merdipullorum]|nr:UDP-glucose 4-epimerase GalE [Candidatus Anaerotignum merdipullorum]